MREELSSDALLSRREALRRAALGGLAVAAAASLGPGLPVATLADTGDGSIEGFLVQAYAARAHAMSTGDLSLLTGLYDPAGNDLLAFERARTEFFHDELGGIWDASMMQYGSNLTLVGLEIDGSTAVARLHGGTNIAWIPRSRPAPVLPPEVLRRRQREPERFKQVPTGPHGEIDSSIGTRHEVRLIKGGSGWRIAADAYDETGFFGPSPDLVAGGWAAVGGPGPSTGVQAGISALNTTPDGTCYVNWTGVQNYALRYCCSGCRNGGYCDYSSCSGGNCSNFVSQ